MFGLPRLSLAVMIAFLATASALTANEPETLLTRLSEYRYPDSKFHGATMSDAATVDEEGRRTAASTQCRAVMTTADGFDKVVAHYETKLAPAVAPDSLPAPSAESGRSVTTHADSEGRPVSIRIFVVAERNESTTLVISRAATESETHIAWTQYVRH